ncbi:MAG: hypothetical protein QW369_02580 [Desulfurococcaceae archaeon]
MACENIVKVSLLKASDVAKLLSQSLEGDVASKIFGEYALANSIY